MKYDVVIVGGGAAGCVLAGRLAANAQTSVLLLEAGSDYADPAHLPDEIKLGHTRFAEAPDSRHNWALRGTITEEQGAIHVAQGKVIGGGSSINGQAMQRGFPEDFDSWAALGNDEWSYDKVVPYFRKSERDLDIQDNYCHGADGPMPVRRRQSGPWPAIQQAFHAASVEAGFGTTQDKNGLHPAGLGVSPSNNIDGVRMSTAMTHLDPVRHHLNLTVRGGVFVRKIVIEDGKAVGVEAESGGKVFHIEAGRVVLSAGAIRSPHLLMLSGIGPEDHLWQFGIPAVRHLPGVGQNLWNHLSAQTTFKVKDGVSLAAHRDAVHFSLHYTAPGSSAVNDMVLRTSPVVDERQERVPGVRTRYLIGDVPPEQAARILCTLGLPDGSGHVRLGLGRPQGPAVLQLSLSAAPQRHSTGAGRRAIGGKTAGIRRVQGRGRPPDPAGGRHSRRRRRLGPLDPPNRGHREARLRHLQDGTRCRPDGGRRPILPGQGRPRPVGGRRVDDAAHSPVRRRPCHGDHDRRTRRRLDRGGLTPALPAVLNI